MKNAFLFGTIFLLIGGILFYVKWDDLRDLDGLVYFMPGILLGIGFGLMIGSVLGYQSKAKNVKKAQLKKEQAELKKSTTVSAQ